MREIITLQFGAHANYVGMHFWNMARRQAEARRSDAESRQVLFGEQTQGGADLFRPRALVFDQADGFGSLGHADMQSTGDDERDQEDALWGGATEVHRQLPHSQPEPEQPLRDRRMRFWSDYRQVAFDSRSLATVSGVEFGNSLGEMTTFDEGARVFAGSDARGDVLEDGFRIYAEACDQVQGFQALADASGGFAGYAASFIERVRDEYPKSPVLLYSVDAASTRDIAARDGRQAVDIAVATVAALENASVAVSLFVPSRVRGPFSGVVPGDLFGTSGMLAMNVAQWMQPLVEGSRMMDEVVALVTQQSYLRVAESMLAPALQGVSAGLSAADIIDSRFTACSDVVLAGGLRNLGGGFAVDRGTAFGDVLADRLFEPARWHSIEGAAMLPTTFPRILRDVGPDGFLSATNVPDPVDQVCVAGLLCTAGGTSEHLQRLHSTLSAEASKYLKDYERDTIRGLRYVLDAEIDKYAEIG
ncbi:mtDNA inheritance, partitioning of the mitochondrial organelle [Coemansia sp. RSA 1933]|nr:mtDNA inheritance, partitioning of the mitochondrial organelle [Coemansia sp. RSA 1933]